MSQIILMAVTIFGGVYVIGHSQISLPFRTLLARSKSGLFFVNLLECPACASFHIGWILALAGEGLFEHTLKGALWSAFFHAGASYLLARLTGLIPPSWAREEMEKHISEF